MRYIHIYLSITFNLCIVSNPIHGIIYVVGKKKSLIKTRNVYLDDLLRFTFPRLIRDQYSWKLHTIDCALI